MLPVRDAQDVNPFPSSIRLRTWCHSGSLTGRCCSTIASAVTIADACNALLMNGTRFFMATSNEPKRVPERTGFAWPVRRAADSGQRDAGRQWRNKLAGDPVANCYMSELMSGGLRTARYVTSVSGRTKSKRTFSPTLCVRQSRGQAHAHTGKGATGRY